MEVEARLAPVADVDDVDLGGRVGAAGEKGFLDGGHCGGVCLGLGDARFDPKEVCIVLQR